MAASFGSAVLVLLAAAAPLGSSAPGPDWSGAGGWPRAVAAACAHTPRSLTGERPADRDDP
ncbi:hypothetical protein, partial [Kitasatospora albolonga]|uniref:hypothetical protein n=1 Tax=Kitasatospora albolonga TaxID=68173 RepID=UPI0031E729CA